MQFRDFFPVSTNTSLKESGYGALGAFVGLFATPARAHKQGPSRGLFVVSGLAQGAE